MNDELRRLHVLGFEGQTLNFAATHGLETGLLHTRCVIDGAANALARLDGEKNAAHYLYAVADRIVGDVREPTALPQALLPAPKAAQLIHAIEEVVDEPLPRVLQPARPQWLGAIATIAALFAIAMLWSWWHG